MRCAKAEMRGSASPGGLHKSTATAFIKLSPSFMLFPSYGGAVALGCSSLGELGWGQEIRRPCLCPQEAVCTLPGMCLRDFSSGASRH